MEIGSKSKLRPTSVFGLQSSSLISRDIRIVAEYRISIINRLKKPAGVTLPVLLIKKDQMVG